ncbi:unnamed protein product [Symbiodinium necroappetens]|uniref:RRM domain-containing protein n=1 Tax=Symbiodinium necroappetens TaxID=1628268 RepID=A0A813BQL6_9DINO|nr:unnamed protein product [Symbiodinium necroappetens]
MTEMCANFGPVFFVKLHRERNPDVNGENPFNGTVQVEFESEEAAVAIVAMEHHLMWKDQKIQASEPHFWKGFLLDFGALNSELSFAPKGRLAMRRV